MGKEGQPSGVENALAVGRNLSIVGGIIGAIGYAAKSEFAASFLFPSGVAFVVFEGTRQVLKNRRKKKGQ